MCGIFGNFYRDKNTLNLEKFLNALKEIDHRGPDDFGVENICLNNGQLVIGHKRLSILDLSTNGHQPMFSDDSNLIMSSIGLIICPER